MTSEITDNMIGTLGRHISAKQHGISDQEIRQALIFAAGTHLAEARERAEKAERREEQFSGWWAGVSKQLRDLQAQYDAETWARAESCETHGQQIKDLDADVLRLQRRERELEGDRVRLVTGLHVLQDIVRAHRAGHTRTDLTVDELIGAIEAIVWRTLDQKPETEKRPQRVVQASLFDVAGGAA